MLRGLRKASANWLGKLVMAAVVGFLVISFAIWGIGDIFRGFGLSSLAKVGSTEISVEQFRRTYNEKLQELGRRMRRPITAEQARVLGLERQIVGQMIAEASLDEVLVLFPDPWHKKRHHKRRLIQPPFVELIASRLRQGGVLRLATDWEEYALQMLEVLSAAKTLFTNLSPTGDWMPRPEERAPTRFEKRGARLGHGVWDVAFSRL